MMTSKNQPFFTIVIATYNRPEYVLEAIKSIESQSFQNFEVIIVNDGSSKDYTQFENYIKHKDNFHYYHKINEGRSTARNYSISRSKSTYVCLLDDDDLFNVDHLEHLHSKIISVQEPIAIFYTLQQLLFASGKVENVPLNSPKKHQYGDFSKYLNCSSSTVCIHRAIFLRHQFNPKLSYWEDWDLWFSILKEYPEHPIHKHTVKIRLHDDQTIIVSKKSMLDKYNGIKWLYLKHKDIIPKKIYLKWKVQNLLSLARISLIEKNFKRSRLFLILSLKYSFKSLGHLIFWVVLFKSSRSSILKST